MNLFQKEIELPVADFLRDFFVPTHRNKMVPVGLSRQACMFYLLIACVLITSSGIGIMYRLATPIDLTHFQSKDMIDLVNQARVSAGLPPLQENSVLDSAANAKALDMFAQQYFSHVTPAGLQPWAFLEQSDYKYSAAGENLAIDFFSPQDAHEALMNSPSHRANIVNPLYTDVGVAVREGVFDGHASVVVVQFFGRPYSLLSVAKAATVTAPPPAPVTAMPPPAFKPAPPPPIASKPIPAPTSTAIKLPAPTPPAKTSIRSIGASSSPVRTQGKSTTMATQNTSTIQANKDISHEGIGAAVGMILQNVSDRTEAQLLSLLIIALLLIPMGFMLSRIGKVHYQVLARPMLVIFMLLYVSWGVMPNQMPRAHVSLYSAESVNVGN